MSKAPDRGHESSKRVQNAAVRQDGSAKHGSGGKVRNDPMKKVIDALALASAIFAVVQFFAWDYSFALKWLFAAVAFSACWFCYGPFLRQRIAVVAIIFGALSSILIGVVFAPSPAERYAEEYIRITQESHIWSSGSARFPDAITCMVRHYDAIKPGQLHWERDMPDARVVELAQYVEYSAYHASEPIVIMGQIIRSEPALDVSEYIIQVAPITEAQRSTWASRRVGEQAVKYAEGSLEDLYPRRGTNDEDINGIVYARVKLRPLDLPIEGLPIVVRGCPIVYGGYDARSGRNLDAVYLAGSSARVNE